MSDIKPLDIQLITFIHQYWGLHSEFLTPERAYEEYGIPYEAYRASVGKQAVRDDLVARGLPQREVLDAFRSFADAPEGLEDQWVAALQTKSLTPHQLAVANALLDLADTRSLKKKLQDSNVRTATYNEWLKDPVFSGYLKKRSEDMLGENQHEAHLALMDKVRAGDTAALKFYYEMQNIYVEKSKQGDAGSAMDFQRIIANIIEIIQDEIEDLPTIMRIGERLSDMIAANNTASAIVSSVGAPNQIEQPKIAKAREITPELEALMGRSNKSD